MRMGLKIPTSRGSGLPRTRCDAPIVCVAFLCAVTMLLASPGQAGDACSPPFYADPEATGPAPVDPTLSVRDCIRYLAAQELTNTLARAARIELFPLAIKMADRFGATYNKDNRRVVVSLGALRRPEGIQILAGPIAHEIGHAG